MFFCEWWTYHHPYIPVNDNNPVIVETCRKVQISLVFLTFLLRNSRILKTSELKVILFSKISLMTSDPQWCCFPKNGFRQEKTLWRHSKDPNQTFFPCLKTKIWTRKDCCLRKRIVISDCLTSSSSFTAAGPCDVRKNFYGNISIHPLSRISCIWLHRFGHVL